MPVSTLLCPEFRSTAVAQALLLACLTAGAGFGAAAVQAQDSGAVARTDARDYDIAAGPLDRALNAFAARAGIVLAADGSLTVGKSSPGVQGRYTVTQALERLLAGSGLSYRSTGADTVTLEPAVNPVTGTVTLDTVTVTSTLVGTRIWESAAETSASVEFFSAEDIQQRPGIGEVQDLYEKTPNIVDFGDGVFAPAVRGVDGSGPATGGLGFIAGTRPRLTLSVDGRPLSTFELVGGPTGLWDVEQVEVYRGPQTTLQGRNSVAGAIVVETRDPTFYWEGSAQTAVGTEDRHRLSALLSGPVVEDTLAFRLAVDHQDGSSFVDFQGLQGVDDIEDDDYLNIRGKLLLEPAALADFSAQLTVSHINTRRPQSQLSDPPFGDRERVTSQTAFEIDTTSVGLELEYFLNDRLKLSNTTTYADIVFDRLDASANGQFRLEGPQVTNELLLNYDDEDAGIQGVLGLYLFDEDREDSLFVGTPLAAILDDKTLTTSLFGEVEWPIAGGLYLTVGARYERESRQRSGEAFGIGIGLDETFEAFLPKLGLGYEVSDTTTVGFVVSRGFNAGGGSVSFGASDSAGNSSPDPALGPRSFSYDPEFVWNYELYLRHAALNDRLVFNANLFYSDYRDQQRVEQLDFPGGFTDSIITNTPESRAYGAELGATFAPSERVKLFADIGLLDTEIVESGDPALEGNEFARAPSFSASVGALFYPKETWTLGVDGRYVGSYYSTDVNSSRGEVDPYFIANGKVSWEPNERVKVFGSVTNVFDSDAEQRLFAFPATAEPSLANVVEPRVFWLGAELSF